jgi:hypothetical protein
VSGIRVDTKSGVIEVLAGAELAGQGSTPLDQWIEKRARQIERH